MRIKVVNLILGVIADIILFIVLLLILRGYISSKRELKRMQEQRTSNEKLVEKYIQKKSA